MVGVAGGCGMGVWLVGVADLHSMVGECDCFLCCGLLIRHANYRGKVISFCAPIFSTASRVEKSGVQDRKSDV